MKFALNRGKKRKWKFNLLNCSSFVYGATHQQQQHIHHEQYIWMKESGSENKFGTRHFIQIFGDGVPFSWFKSMPCTIHSLVECASIQFHFRLHTKFHVASLYVNTTIRFIWYVSFPFPKKKKTSEENRFQIQSTPKSPRVPHSMERIIFYVT